MIKKNTKRFLIFSSAILIIFSLNFVGGEIVKNCFYFFSNPLQKKAQQAGEGIENLNYLLSTKKVLQRKNEELEKEKNQLLWQQSEKARLEKENRALREVLNTGLDKEFELSSVQIIAENLEAGWILINKGKEQELREGSAVITSDKILVGLIETLYSNQARVRLLTSPELSIKAKILSNNKEGIGVVNGEGQGRLRLELIPLEYPLGAGQVIVTSISEGEYPSGLIIGQIQNVIKDNLESFQKAALSPFYLRPDSELLFVILDF